MLVLMGDRAKNGSRRASLELFRLQIVASRDRKRALYWRGVSQSAGNIIINGRRN